LAEQNVMTRGHVYSSEESVGWVTTQYVVTYKINVHT